MRRRLVTITLAALVVVIAVPLGAALTLDSLRLHPAAGSHPAIAANAALASDWRRLPEAGALAVTGGLLLGLAAAVKRAS